MLYVTVTDRQQKGTCALCSKNLLEGTGYTRNLETTEIYCCAECCVADAYCTALNRGQLVGLPAIIPIIGGR